MRVLHSVAKTEQSERAEGEIQTVRQHAGGEGERGGGRTDDATTHLSTLPMNTVMKLRMCSRLSAELSKISSANRRRKIKKSAMFSTKNSGEEKRMHALAQVVSHFSSQQYLHSITRHFAANISSRM